MDEQQQNDEPQVVQPQWQYQSGQLEQPTEPQPVVAQQPPQDTEESNALFSWTASEFVSHEKPAGWYIFLGIAAVIIAAIIFVITREIFSIVVVVVLAIAFAVFGNLKPRNLDYAIEQGGISIGTKHFGYETFRSFAVIDDGPVPSIQLLPQKRFMVPITIYFAPEDGEQIIETLGDFLPFEHKKRDTVDKLSSRIRF